MVKRELWLRNIRPFYESDLIKVLTGMRRSGKSVVLQQIRDEIAQGGVPAERIIFMNFEDLRFSFIQDEMSLYAYVQERMTGTGKYYLFFDEIQNVPRFEKALNSFRVTGNVSIFVTGSNANLLSGELATLLSGRYVSFRIMPFTFREACEMRHVTNPGDEDLMEYLRWGGMPQRFSMQTDGERRIFLSDLFDSIVLKDIVTRYKVKNVELLQRIVSYLAGTSSQIFSASSISRFFKSEGRDCSKETLYNYLSYVTASCVMGRAQRYDVAGRRSLATLEKYYLADNGFAALFSTKFDIGAMLENIVYNELVARGHSVQVGVLGDREIDFIVDEGSRTFYVQVAYLLGDDETAAREFGVFRQVKDNYPKYVITADHFDLSRDGIIHRNIIDWLWGR